MAKDNKQAEGMEKERDLPTAQQKDGSASEERLGERDTLGAADADVEREEE